MAIDRVERRLPVVEKTEVQAHMATDLVLFNGKLPTGSTKFDHDGGRDRFR